MSMERPSRSWINRVPEVTAAFWAIKVLSTTVGETAADFLAVRAGLGTILTDAIMLALLAASLVLQMRARRYVPWLYWLTVVLVSIVGTQITDAMTDGLGVSLYASASGFALALLAVFAVWYRTEGTLSIRAVFTARRELFYWMAILLTFALGTAAGDLATEALGLGFRIGTVAFAALIAVVAIAYRFGLDSVLSFWLAYILTRPLGASLGDLLSQSHAHGGLGFGTLGTSAVFLGAISVLVAYLSASAPPRAPIPIEEGREP
jgi:uncharacterized membrane-anchored protein